MKVTFLGTGASHGIPIVGCKCAVCQSANPKDKRLRSSIYIETEGRHLLIDPGPDLRQAALREGFTQIDAVLITHEHKDHTAGIDDIRTFNYIMRRAIPFYAQPRVTETIRREYAYAFSEPHYPGAPEIILNPIGNETFDVQGIAVTPINVMHGTLPTTGFRIGNFAYITDAKTIPADQMAKLQGLDTLVINALRTETHPAHMSLGESLQVISELKPRCAYLTHISHKIPVYEELIKMLPDNVNPAYDGLKIDID
ncbi:MAG: MBL fold metallo-hydrolase [Salinivirgaceae bacterium]|nr:MBL fold metallo-hydrolase [Salinivirgaceae bacterium]